MDTEPKNYELAYLLSSSLLEDNVLPEAHRLSACIEEAKGIIKHAENPKRRKLAYPINKETEAYWGWTTFSSMPQQLTPLRKRLKEAGSLLRYLLTEEEEIESRPLMTRRFVPRPRPIETPSRPPSGAEKPEEKLDLEALDKKLEEILGK
jgi:ribosomal protein S6